MTKLTMDGKYQTSIGDFEFHIETEGEQALALWDLIFKQSAGDEGIIDLTGGEPKTVEEKPKEAISTVTETAKSVQEKAQEKAAEVILGAVGAVTESVKGATA